jgi:hypothetical protein
VLINPLPGGDRAGLLRILRELRDDARATLVSANSAPSTRDYLGAYFKWANDAVKTLHQHVSAADLDRLVLTKRYELLLNATDRGVGNRTFNSLVSIELEERARALDAAQQRLHEQITWWSHPGEIVLFDTTVFVMHPRKLEEMDFTAILQSDHGLRLIVPMLVVDELDGLKQRGDNAARWRAGYTLAVLDRLLANPADRAVLGPGVTVETLFDPPGHTRLPIPDDEIIDRATAVCTLAAKPVTLLTYDTGQSMRARAAGLVAVKLDVERGHEPAPRRLRS